MARSPARAKPPSARKEGKRRKFIVSIASSIGGGRFAGMATSPQDAAEKALRRRFVLGKEKRFPRNLDIIVTDLSKRRNAQSFFAPGDASVRTRLVELRKAR